MQAPERSSLAHRLALLVDARFRGNWAEAARACGISPTGLQKIKEGSDPRASTLERIALSLGVSLDALILGDNVAEDPADYVAAPVATNATPYEVVVGRVLDALERGGLRLPASALRGLFAFATTHDLAPGELDRLVAVLGAVDGPDALAPPLQSQTQD